MVDSWLYIHMLRVSPYHIPRIYVYIYIYTILGFTMVYHIVAAFKKIDKEIEKGKAWKIHQNRVINHRSIVWILFGGLLYNMHLFQSISCTNFSSSMGPLTVVNEN